MPGYIEESFATAREFLLALSRLDPRWGDRPADWIFRGQAQSSWQLTPTAFRSSTDYRYGKELRYTIQSQLLNQIFEEASLVRQFLLGLDAQGLAPPGEIAYGWRDFMGMLTYLVSPRPNWQWPPAEYAPLFALAQHHGIPTRLLDWSTHPYIAAYFAAIDACQRAAAGAQREPLAVWAMATGYYGALVMGSLEDKKWPQLKVVRPPRYSNPNLKAQEGVFTLLVGQDLGNTQAPTLPPLDELLLGRLAMRGDAPTATALRKLTLPAELAGELLRLLSFVDVDATRLFPGPEGVARGIRERAYWDRPQPHSNE